MDQERYREAERALWASVGATPTERVLQLERSGTAIRIQEVGHGAPLIFVHGASNGGASWASLAARLGGFRCVMVVDELEPRRRTRKVGSSSSRWERCGTGPAGGAARRRPQP